MSHLLDRSPADVQPARSPDHPIDPLFLDRWSPRAFTPAAIPEADLMALFEAARWAPSAYNRQPWRFLYARRGDAHWAGFLELLVPFNIGWARHAAALVFVLSDRVDQAGAPSPTHSLDTGAAWVQLALQATRSGYHARGMAGIDFERARRHLRVPDRFALEMAIAVGRRGPAELLPAELRDEERPTPRRPVAEIAFPGPFPEGSAAS